MPEGKNQGLERERTSWNGVIKVGLGERGGKGKLEQTTFSSVYVFLLSFLPPLCFLAAPLAYRSSQARDGTHSVAVTRTTAVSSQILNPLSHEGICIY